LFVTERIDGEELGERDQRDDEEVGNWRCEGIGLKIAMRTGPRILVRDAARIAVNVCVTFTGKVAASILISWERLLKASSASATK
jgi:hypothetical protein